MQPRVSGWVVKVGATLDLAELVGPEREVASGGDGRVLLAQGAAPRCCGG